ncbi:MAG TPA: putative LPS assembly protein LptD [Candidatus Binatia bacterium]|nr:putative LPS assembly protein LptD [Candidatus Binatia bacterium]
MRYEPDARSAAGRATLTGAWSLATAIVSFLLVLVPPSAARAQPAETYRLQADRLEGSLTGAENVYTAIHPTLIHGTTTVTGDSALVYRTREYVIFRGNVKIVDGTTTMWGDEATYDRKQRLATLRGNVRIQERGTRISGSEAWLYRDRNLSVITGRPHMVDSTRTLDADRIEYDRNTDVVLALGRVDAVDTAESTRVVAGRVRYDRRADYAWADQTPRLELTESNGTVTKILADSLEFDRVNDRVFAQGKVQVARDSLRATGGRAAFFRKENRALLVESPKAWDAEGSASGDTLEIRFVEHKVSSIQARPNAKVAYEAKADSVAGRSERTTASGDTITLYLENEAARRAVIVGRASSFYWPSAADSAKGGRNASNGDTIVVDFDQGKPRHATVQGNGSGTYYMAAEGDTTGAEKRERILYSGDQIAYDLKRNTVDVQGGAAVVYREMNLKAKQVHFDADTQKMRAEGNPVLQDGSDRIVGQTMTYDLAIRRGAVLAGRTKYEQGYVTGDRVLRVSEDILDIKSGTYTTCDLPDPHYHFGAGKMRILLRDKVIAKPVVFYIKHVPVLAIPFYIFPINSGRHSGFMLPQFEFGSSSAAGKFVRNVGYYWAVSDYLDLTGAADYFQDNNWIAHGLLRYAKRYSYHGQVTGSFQDVFGAAPPTRNWHLEGTHYQPMGSNSQLTADFNLTNSAAYLRDPTVGQSLANRVNRVLRSSVGYSKGWSRASLTAGLSRIQDLSPDPGAARIQQQLPTATFSLQPRPIGWLARSGIPARLPWLATTVYSYDMRLLSQRNVIANRYSDLLHQTDLRDSIVDARTAMLHSASLSDTRHLGPLALQPRLGVQGVYYSKDQAGDRNRVGGAWNASVGANTQIFGTMTHPIGPLRALRHVLTPAVTLFYQPRIQGLSFTDTSGVLRPRFSGVGGIGLSSFEQQNLTFSLRNDIHVKVGSADRPKIINSLISANTTASYDLLAKRQGRRPLSDIQTSLVFRPIERSDFSFSFTHDPYTLNLKGMTASTGFQLQGTSRAAEDSIQAMSDEPGEAAVRTSQNYLVNEGLTSTSLPWRVGFAVNLSGNRDPAGKWVSESTVNSTLGLNVSRGWRLDYHAQYNATHRNLVAQGFTVTRELHCWEAQFTRSISGDNKEYYFKINVKLLPEVYYEQGSRGLRGFGGQNVLTGGGY